MKHHDESERLPASMPQSLMQVHAVHEVLQIVLRNRLPLSISDEERQLCLHYLHALCWVLGHDEPDEIGAEFANFIRGLMNRLVAESVQNLDNRLERHEVN